MRYHPCLQIDGGRDGIGYREIVPGPVVWDCKERDCATLLTVKIQGGLQIRRIFPYKFFNNSEISFFVKGGRVSLYRKAFNIECLVEQ